MSGAGKLPGLQARRVRLPGHKHKVLGLLNAQEFKMPRFSPDNSCPWFPFADTHPTLPQTKTSCNATGDAGLGEVGWDTLGEQGRQPRAQGQTGPSSPQQPQRRGRGRPGPRGAKLLSARPLAGALIAFHLPQELLLVLIGHSGDAGRAMGHLTAALQLAAAALSTITGPRPPPALQQREMGQGTRGLSGRACLIRTTR